MNEFIDPFTGGQDLLENRKGIVEVTSNIKRFYLFQRYSESS